MLVGVHFFPLQLHVAVDLVFGEHVTGQQEVVIGFQAFQSFAQACANGRDTGQLFGRQIVQILVRRFARIDLVLDAVEACPGLRSDGKRLSRSS